MTSGRKKSEKSPHCYYFWCQQTVRVTLFYFSVAFNMLPEDVSLALLAFYIFSCTRVIVCAILLVIESTRSLSEDVYPVLIDPSFDKAMASGSPRKHTHHIIPRQHWPWHGIQINYCLLCWTNYHWPDGHDFCILRHSLWRDIRRKIQIM